MGPKKENNIHFTLFLMGNIVSVFKQIGSRTILEQIMFDNQGSTLFGIIS